MRKHSLNSSFYHFNRISFHHFSSSQNPGKFWVDIDSTMILLYGATWLIPRTPLPCVRVSLIEALPFRQLTQTPLHIRLMMGRLMVKSRIGRTAHKIRNGHTSRDVVLLLQDRFRMKIYGSNTISDKNYPLAFLRRIIVRCTKCGYIHLIAYRRIVVNNLLLHSPSKHTAQPLDVLTYHILRLQVLDNFQHLLI